MNKKNLILTLALALPATLALAQRPGGGPPPGGLPPGPPPNQRQLPQRGGDAGPVRPPEGDRHRPEKPPFQPMLLQSALDGDHDGIISAEEIKIAPDVLKHLDKNKDGKLTPNEFLAPHPDGPPPGDGEQGDRHPRTRTTVSEKNLPPEPFPGTKPKGDAGKKPDGPKEGDGPAPRGQADKRPDGPREGGDKPKRPLPPPLIGALDADGDGVISADEIANSSKALLTLDKNGDGQLGPGEYMGRPPGDHPDGPPPGDRREGRPPGDRPEGEAPKPPRPPAEEQ